MCYDQELPDAAAHAKQTLYLRRIYLKNNPAKFHPDPLWNDGALSEEVTPTRTRTRSTRRTEIWDQFLIQQQAEALS